MANHAESTHDDARSEAQRYNGRTAPSINEALAGRSLADRVRRGLLSASANAPFIAVQPRTENHNVYVLRPPADVDAGDMNDARFAQATTEYTFRIYNGKTNKTPANPAMSTGREHSTSDGAAISVLENRSVNDERERQYTLDAIAAVDGADDNDDCSITRQTDEHG